jgi:hypothetical protein
MTAPVGTIVVSVADPADDVFHRISHEIGEIALARDAIDNKVRSLRAAHAARSADNLESICGELAKLASQMTIMSEHVALVLAKHKEASC